MLLIKRHRDHIIIKKDGFSIDKRPIMDYTISRKGLNSNQMEARNID